MSDLKNGEESSKQKNKPEALETSLTASKNNTETIKSKILANRLGQDFFDSNSGGKKIITRMPLRKPGNVEYFRSNPSFAFEAYMLKTETGEEFMLENSLVPEFSNEAKPKMFARCINRKGDEFLWSISVPDPLRPNGWTESAIEAVKLAQHKWVRTSANMSAQCREIFEAEGVLSEPEWNSMSNEDIIELAFKDRFIETEDHPVIQQLRGKL